MDRRTHIVVDLEDGHSVDVRRLGVGDYFTLVEMVKKVLLEASARSQLLEALAASTSINGMLSVLFTGMSAAKDEFPKWLETLPVQPGIELYGRDFYLIFLAVMTGPDFTCFLDLWPRLTKHPAVVDMIQKMKESRTAKQPSTGPSI